MEPRRSEPPRNPGNLDKRDRGKRAKVVRRAFVKPLNLLTLVAGLGIFITTGQLWLLPLTLVVYTVVVYLAMNDPVFVERVTGSRDPSNPEIPPSRDVSPERRSRWLPRGEARQKVEGALVTYRKVLVAIEESDDVTARVLEGAVPKLNEAANRLVDVASNRERAALTLKDFDTDTESSETTKASDERGISQRQDSLSGLRNHIKQADVEIDEISNQFLNLRAQVVRASMDSAGTRQQSEMINESLDNLNYRLEALNETFDGESQR